MSFGRFVFEDEEGNRTDEVRVQRISPLLVIQTLMRQAAQRPEPPVVEYTMPDGLVQRDANPGDPEYKEALENFYREMDAAVASAILASGVPESDQGKLEGKEPEAVASLVRTIRSISMATEEGVERATTALSGLFIEGIIAARWANLDLKEFWGMPAEMQNVLVAAYRRAMGIQLASIAASKEK